MAQSFSELRAKRTQALTKLNSQLEKINSGGFKKEDERLWNPTVDKNGNGYAVIRFLPAPENEDEAFVLVHDHGFKGPTGKWYIELSRSTIGEPDPVMEMNSKLWEQGEGSAGRKVVSGDTSKKQPGSKRRKYFYSNIYVVEDPDAPENEGKVFLFKYGAKIFGKLNDAMNPKFKDEKKMNPFDLWEGANFKLKIRKVEGQRNYDSSGFDVAGPLANKTDTELEGIWKQEYSLQAFLDPKNYKSYDELQKKLNSVMDVNGTPASRADRDEPSREEARSPRREEPRQLAPTEDAKAPPAEDDEESLEFFRKLGEPG